MRKYLGAAVLAGALVAGVGGCSSPKGGTGHRSDIGSGATGSGGAGYVFGAGSPGIDPGNLNGGGGVPDADPGNPNISHPSCLAGTCLDFPTTPIMGEGVPPNAPALFGAPSNFTPGSTLCVLEPQLSSPGKEGAMLPANWVRPRFRVAGVPAGIDVLEIRIHSPAEANDLVAYTKYAAVDGITPSWYLPKDIWIGTPPADASMNRASGNGFANNAAGQPVTVLIRGVNSNAPAMPVGIQGDFNIAPVVATGSMVFWTVNSGKVTPDSSRLLGFAVGDEGVANALTLADVKWTGEIGENGAALRGFYDKVPLEGFKDGQVRCIGCHTTLPDATGGASVLFGDDWPWSLAGATLTTGAVPAVLKSGAQAIMKTPWWGQQTTSKMHWTDGDHIIVTSYGTTFNSGMSRTKPWQELPSYDDPKDKVKYHALAWINADYVDDTIPLTLTMGQEDYGPDLAARNAAVTMAKGTGWGTIATGDSMVSDVSPNLSHDGNSIVYVATDKSPDGHPDATALLADVKTVAYNGHMGSTSAPLLGASDPSLLEYYPSYSQDDKLIAFTRAPKPGSASPDGPYYNRFGKIVVVPATGATVALPEVELVANDPGTCGGDDVTKGIINSWPKWSPDAVHHKGNSKTYYFLVFSSARKYGDEFSKQFELEKNPESSFTGLAHSSQLYLAAVVVDDQTHAITSYPAVYIWNQNRTPAANGTATMGLKYSNLTPAWDPIKLPDLVIPDAPSVIPK